MINQSYTIDKKEQKRAESIREDHEIIKKALEGDQDSYTRLMKKYHDPVFSLVFKIIHDKEEIEDLVQETFIKAFGSLKSFNENYSFSTWIFKIASNNCIDYMRKKKLKTLSIDMTIEQEEGESSFELPDPSYETDKNLIEEQRKKIIQDAINSLPEKYKVVIQMRHQEEKNYDEISEILCMPIGTVKAHIFRAREMLNKYLKDKRVFL
jgi:RNA polymerase sigma factor (sigma-70 family)